MSGSDPSHSGAADFMLLEDLVCGRPNSWAKLYDPSRVTIAATGSTPVKIYRDREGACTSSRPSARI